MIKETHGRPALVGLPSDQNFVNLRSVGAGETPRRDVKMNTDVGLILFPLTQVAFSPRSPISLLHEFQHIRRHFELDCG